jgi:hypothetical protein
MEDHRVEANARKLRLRASSLSYSRTAPPYGCKLGRLREGSGMRKIRESSVRPLALFRWSIKSRVKVSRKM